jgi:site-specific DNA-cytosine methylase
MINSSLVSAQNRVRLYWTNIEGIDQPEDKGIMLEDIIGDHYVGGAFRGRNIVDGKRVDYKGAPTVQRFEARTDGKSNCLTTVTKDTVVVPVIKSHGELIFKPHKSQCLDANYHKGADNHGQRTGVIELGHAELNGHDIIKRVYSPKGKAPTLTAVCGGNQEKKIAVDASHWRKLTTVECERLQTVPDGYTDGVSKTQRYKMIGNSFTVDVIAHLLKNIKE